MVSLTMHHINKKRWHKTEVKVNLVLFTVNLYLAWFHSFVFELQDVVVILLQSELKDKRFQIMKTCFPDRINLLFAIFVFQWYPKLSIV